MLKTNKRIQVLFTTCAVMGLSACAGYSAGPTTDGYGNPVQAPDKEDVQLKSAVTDPRFGGPISIIKTESGPVIGGGEDKLTLYTFDKDQGKVSVCYDGCAAAWPPFLAGNPTLATDSLTITGRKDGSLQWVFEGQPLYFWAGDTEQGQTTGENVPNWAVARP